MNPLSIVIGVLAAAGVWLLAIPGLAIAGAQLAGLAALNGATAHARVRTARAGRDRWGPTGLLLVALAVRGYVHFGLLTFIPLLEHDARHNSRAYGSRVLALMLFAGALGTLAAVNRGRLADRVIMACSVAGVSMPVFFIGLILIQYVGFKWGLLPFTGRTGPVWDGGLPSLILPAVTLGLVLIGPIARLTRTAVLEVLGADFVRTARAKGLRETVVIVHHALRNALIPVVTLIGLQAAFLLGGAVVTETMFSWPGVGRLAVGAIVSSDFPTAQGAIMILAIAFLSINLLVDVLYVYLDPRLQRS